MLFKLALRNVRRRALTYIVYFVTVVLTAALMLASNGILFAEELLWYAFYIYAAVIIMTRFVSVLVAAAVCFIVCHIMTWLLARRRRELGTYMLLGVPRGKLIKLFAAENAIVCFASLALGCGLGVGLFFIFGAMLNTAVSGNVVPLSLNPTGVLVTVAEWLVIFFIAIAWSSRTLKKSRISDLVYGQRDKRKTYTPRTDRTVSVAGAVMFAAAFIVMITVLAVSLATGNGDAGPVIAVVIALCLIAAIAGIFVFYIGLRGLPLGKIFKRKPADGQVQTGAVVYKDAAYNPVTLVSCRSRARTMNTNAVITAVIAALMTIAIVFTCFMFGLRYSLLEARHERTVFDFSCKLNPNIFSSNNMSVGELIEEAEKYAEVKDVIVYTLYDDEQHGINEIMSESDANALFAYCGEQPIDVDAGHCVYVSTYPQSVPETETVFGETLACETKIVQSLSDVTNYATNIIVVDDALIGTDAAAEAKSVACLQFDVDGNLPPEFFETVERNGAMGIISPIREIHELNSILSAGVIASLFLGITFTLLSMAILSLRITADAAGERRRYAILSVLGMKKSTQKRMMRNEMFKFFALPLLLPLISAVPTLGICTMVCDFVGGALQAGFFISAIALPLSFVGILACYFAATYFMSLHIVLRPNSSRASLLSVSE